MLVRYQAALRPDSESILTRIGSINKKIMLPAIYAHIPVREGLKHRPHRGWTFSRENEGIHEIAIVFQSVSKLEGNDMGNSIQLLYTINLMNPLIFTWESYPLAGPVF